MQRLGGLPPDAQKFHGGVITIGNYDGLHLGHQSLLARMAERTGPRVVVTFDPHPTQILQPARYLKRLFPREDLSEQLPGWEVDLLMVLPFDQAFARLTANEFLDRYVGVLRPKHIVAGYDFAFGSGREGTLDVLKHWAAGLGTEVDVVPPLRMGGEIVSSRRIRDLVAKGDVFAASLLLGRPYYLRGEVVAGAGRGAHIGVPTLNQKVVNETLPALGVYASRARCAGKSFASVTNVGTSPTFENGSTVKVETHVIEAAAEWRGQVIDVDLIERLRDEKKFSGVEELQKQIHSDILKAKGMLGVP